MGAQHTVKPGDTLWEVRSERAGNTTMRRKVARPVYIVEVHDNHVVARWNGNTPQRFSFYSVARWRRTEPKREASVMRL